MNLNANFFDTNHAAQSYQSALQPFPNFNFKPHASTSDCQGSAS